MWMLLLQKGFVEIAFVEAFVEVTSMEASVEAAPVGSMEASLKVFFLKTFVDVTSMEPFVEVASAEALVGVTCVEAFAQELLLKLLQWKLSQKVSWELPMNLSSDFHKYFCPKFRGSCRLLP